MRKTLYGTVVPYDELDENEKALLYIKECAESVGIVVTEDTQFSIVFIADVMRRMREQK